MAPEMACRHRLLARRICAPAPSAISALWSLDGPGETEFELRSQKGGQTFPAKAAQYQEREPPREMLALTLVCSRTMPAVRHSCEELRRRRAFASEAKLTGPE